MMRGLLPSAICLLLFVAGCPSPHATRPPQPDELTKPVPIVNGLAAEVRAARTKATADYCQRLDQIAIDVESGAIKYDTKLQLELNQAARESSRPIQDILARIVPKGEITDRATTASNVRSFREAHK